VIHLLDKSGRQKSCDLLADGAALFLIETAQTLLHRLRAWPDLQGMLNDFSRYARHIRGLPREDVFIGAEEVDERAYLFGGEFSADPHPLVPRVVGVDEDLFGSLHGLKGSDAPPGVGRLLRGFLPDDYEFLKGVDHRGKLATLHLALVGTLESGADSDDPTRARHLELEVHVVGDGHELHIARPPQGGVVGSVNSTTSSVRVSIL
jgi:hypothetical protein